MKRKELLFPVAGLLLSMSLSHAAFAQCGAISKHVAYTVPAGSGGVRFQLAAATQTTSETSDAERWAHGTEPIVGMWKMDFEDPAHGFSDKGYSVWHSDHTEFMNSTRPPSGGAVCEGVWERVGDLTYRLNHFAIAYGDGVNLTSLYHFNEEVRVDQSGNSFSGTFTIRAYDPKTHVLQGEYQGRLTGERVTIDTTAESQKF